MFIEIHLILDHPKTGAFVTYAATNGIYDAIIHRNPMVSIHLFEEQHGNIAQIQGLDWYSKQCQVQICSEGNH